MAEHRPDDARPAPDKWEQELSTDLDDRTDDKPRGMPLHTKILLGLVLGAVTGLIASATLGPEDPRLAWTVRNLAQPIGGLFVRLLLMIVIPLVFSALVVGVAGVGDIRKLGRVGAKAFGYTLVVSAISVVIGLTLANTIRPGERVSAATAAALEARYGEQAQARVEAAEAGQPAARKAPLTEAVETLIPANPIASIAGDTPNLLHLMFFALALGVAATLVKASVVA
ncbi:MAG TPA: cation:dicarboxylase symporter family transporter, partial [Armatimonadota bacterium]|nr:cation:dicarboxylase symporter family transporter [Armatimonadota bacterium]